MVERAFQNIIKKKNKTKTLIYFVPMVYKNDITNWLDDGIYDICKLYYLEILKEIQDDSLSVHCVWAYLRHIPREKVDKGFSRKVYTLANKCFYDLYIYSKTKEYISANTDLDTFLYKDWYH